MNITQPSPTAADSGSDATEAFRAGSARHGSADSDRVRISTLVRALLDAVRGVIRENEVSYAEFQAAKGWLIELGEGGEWPLFLDVFVEHEVEKVAERSQQGTKGTIEGPYYLPDQARLPAVATLPQRADERGDVLVLTGQTRSLDGTPLGRRRDRRLAGRRRRLLLRVRPAPARRESARGGRRRRRRPFRDHHGAARALPHPDRRTNGTMINAAGWQPWRPAHLHVMVRAAKHRPITTQLYFAGGAWLDSDIASATKDELILTPERVADHGLRVAYDFQLEPV